MSEIPDVGLYQRIVDVFLKEKKVAAVVKELQVPASKVRRVLITEGLWSSRTSRRIAEFLAQNMKKDQIAIKLNCTVKAVEFYLPYKRGAYQMKNRSETARRIDNYRKRNTSASSFQVFHNNSPEAALKEQIKAEEEKKKMDINQLYKSVMDKPPMFLKLKLELVDDEKADLSALRMYGKAENGFTREILISSDFSLHQLHYAIQRAFGWQNRHPHFFTFPKETIISLLQAIGMGNRKSLLFNDWEKVCGIYFRYPIKNQNDLHWDDDYDGKTSIRTWLREKYTGQFQYHGYAEHCLECKGATATVRETHPYVHVYETWQENRNLQFAGNKPEGKMVPYNEVTFDQANILYQGELIQLLERLPVVELLLPVGTMVQQGWEAKIRMLAKTAAVAYAENMEKVKTKKTAIAKALNLIQTSEIAGDLAFREAYTNYRRFILQFNPHVIPVTKELIYHYDYLSKNSWEVKITCEEVYYTKDGWDYPDAGGWVVPPITRSFYQAQTEGYNRDNEIVNETLRQQILRCFLDCRPQCLTADGMNVMEDVGGLSGFADFLMKIHDEDIDKREQLLIWAHGQGWNGRNLKAKNIL